MFLLVPGHLGSPGQRAVKWLLLLFFVFVCLYGYGFLSGGKCWDVKFCMHIGLLSRQVFSPFGEFWLAGSHGGSGLLPG